MPKITIGVIGAGRIGQLHTENIRYNFPEVHIKTVADVFPDRVQGWAKSLGVEKIVRDAHEIFNDPEIQAVLVCSSTDTHAGMVVAAAECGKHIFCEKPIDLTVAKVKRAIAAVEQAGVKMQIGFMKRFDHNYRRLRDLVQSGAVGEPQIIRVSSRDPAPPPVEYIKVSGGIYLDMMIHDFDMVRYLSGSEVVEVYAQGAVLIDPAIGHAGDVDTALVTLTFANGALGIVDNSRKAAYGYDQRAEVFGSKGVAAIGNDLNSTVVLADDKGFIGDKPLNFFLDRYHQAYLDEMRAFFDALTKDTPVPVAGVDGLMPILIGLAANKSMAEHRPVKVSEIEAFS